MTVDEWIDDIETEEEYPIGEYDLAATPNDFNIMTINTFVESGVVKIPVFQRNYVWDINRASKLIESLIMGLPVPQLFFYEDGKNSYLVIDGQQRLMTIYYFINGRFPRIDKRIELREIFSKNGKIPKETINDDEYFSKFNLKLPAKIDKQKNIFDGKNYQTLGDYETSFNLRPIRSIIVKPNTTSDDDSAIYELFNRLNTGGINLYPQEIRLSLYHSEFMAFIIKINNNANWRRLLGVPIDLHMKDVEILLRAYALLLSGDKYTEPLNRFINNFSKRMKSLKPEKIFILEKIFLKFINITSGLNETIFKTKNNKFSILLFESVFYACCKEAIENENDDIKSITEEKILTLKNDSDFIACSVDKTTATENVKNRLKRAIEIIR